MAQQGHDRRERNPAENLSQQDRIRGGEHSAAMQRRDRRGQFAGKQTDDRRGQNPRQH